MSCYPGCAELSLDRKQLKQSFPHFSITWMTWGSCQNADSESVVRGRWREDCQTSSAGCWWHWSMDPFSAGEGLSVSWMRWHHSRYLRGPCSFCILGGGGEIPTPCPTVILTNVLVTCTSTFCQLINQGDIKESCLSLKLQELT